MSVGALDDVGLQKRLDPLTAEQRTLFAASLAERLMPFFERYGDDAPRQELYRRFQALLDAVWQVPEGRDLGTEVQQLEDSIPDDDEETLLAPFAQNAAIAVIAAAESATGNAAQALRAAISLYEAADYAANLSHPGLDPNEPAYESTIASSSFVQDALHAIDGDLAFVEAAPQPNAHRRLAREQGEQWAATWPGIEQSD